MFLFVSVPFGQGLSRFCLQFKLPATVLFFDFMHDIRHTYLCVDAVTKVDE